MNRNLTSYLIPKLEKFLEDDLKFKNYIKSHFKENNFRDFEDYLKNTSMKDYALYLEILVNYYKGFECSLSKEKKENIIISTIEEFSLETLSDFIFLNETLYSCLKQYMYTNPLQVLAYSDDFLSLIGNFISPYIQNNPGIIFVDYDDNVSFFLNSLSKKNYITLNLSFLKITFLQLLKLYKKDNFEFCVSIKNNKLTFSYGKSFYSCILVNKEDMNSIFNSFGYQNNKEKLQTVNMFYTKDMPYEFFIFYFSKIHRYTSDKYSVFQLWVVERYKDIMTIPYFKRIADEYSVGISVLMHSICPFTETFEYIQSLNPAINDKNKDSFAFSFTLWLYNKRGYYYSNNLQKQKRNY